MLKKSLYIFFGFLFLILSYIGIIMPGIPAIPFILLAVFCFTNSSEKLHHWMLRQKIIGKILTKLKTKKGNVAFKFFVISQLWVSIIVADFIFITNIYYGIFLAICGLAFSWIIYVLMDK